MAGIPDLADRLGRLRHVVAVAALDPAGMPEPVESDSNDTWLLDDARLGPVVLRVSWRGDVTRLGREAAVARRLPAGVRYPAVLGSGLTTLHGQPLGYSLTRRLDGGVLARRWAAMTGAEQRSAGSQLAAMLKEFHRWTPPADLASQVRARADLASGGVPNLVGADVVPFPVGRALELAAHASGMPHVDAGLVVDAVELIGELRRLEPAVDDPARHGLIHGDLHLDNLWWSDSARAIFLDLEWTRFGPPLLDLQPLADNADNEAVESARGTASQAVLRWLVADYPELVNVAEAGRRMRLYSLVHCVRQMIVDPADRPERALPADHPVRRLRRLVDGSWPAPGALPEPLRPT